ncbi:MAG: hypothetical protein ACYCQJ_08755 [Nitrososphaerales archaeon]
MVDAISLVILSAFGGAALIVISGFYLLQHRGRVVKQSAYETQDYYQQYAPKQQTTYSYSRGRFKRDEDIEAEAMKRMRSNGRTILLAIMIFALVAVVVAGLFDYTNFLLLIFLIPLVFSFFRTRHSEDRTDAERDRERR